MKNKTIALWATFIGGPLGLQRIYLTGRYDSWAWITPIPTLLGLYGVQRARAIGLDDPLSWILIPMLGFTFSGCAIAALRYGLMDAQTWNLRFNPGADEQHQAGQTHWMTVFGLASALFIGATVLIATIAFSFQRYFEFTA
ncbi:MAG: hypothetical protein QE279_08800 [Rhodoferax sp.]|jgi:hypothetical protein|nr:hypothetical protein [Rhodoferax sp.]